MTTRTLLTSLCLVLAIPAGCATSDQGAKTPGSDVMIQMKGPQRDHVDLVFHLRQQAKEFREMAQRREVEADLLAAHGDPALEETVKRKQALAHRLYMAADSLDEQAEEAQRQVPHGMVQ